MSFALTDSVAVEQLDEQSTASFAEDSTRALEQIAAPAWDQLSLSFADVTPEQTNIYAASRWSEPTIKRFALRNAGDIAAATLLRSVAVPATGVRLSMARYAPLWRRLDAAADPSILADLFKALGSELASRPSDFLLVFPRCEPEANGATPSALLSAGFKPMTPPGDRRRYFVDLTGNPGELRANLAQKWRYNLKKSEKLGLSVERAYGNDGAERFARMHQQMVTRKRFSESGPIEQLAELLIAEKSDLRPKMFLVTHEGKDVAGAVIDASGDVANYMLGATTPRGFSLKAGYLLQWTVLQHLTTLPRVRWYALGGGTTETCSLHQFKRGLIGKSGRILDEPDAYYRAGSAYASLVGRAVVGARWLHADLMDKLRAKRAG